MVVVEEEGCRNRWRTNSRRNRGCSGQAAPSSFAYPLHNILTYAAAVIFQAGKLPQKATLHKSRLDGLTNGFFTGIGQAHPTRSGSGASGLHPRIRNIFDVEEGRKCINAFCIHHPRAGRRSPTMSRASPNAFSSNTAFQNSTDTNHWTRHSRRHAWPGRRGR